MKRTTTPKSETFRKRKGVDFLCWRCDTYFTVGRDPDKEDFAKYDLEDLVSFERSEDGLSFVYRTDEEFVQCPGCFLVSISIPPPNLDQVGIDPEDLGYDMKVH